MSHVTSLEVLASLAIKSFLSYFIFFSTTPTFIDLTTGFILQSYKVVGTSQVFQRSTSPTVLSCSAAKLRITHRQSKHRPFLLTILPLGLLCRATELRLHRSDLKHRICSTSIPLEFAGLQRCGYPCKDSVIEALTHIHSSGCRRLAVSAFLTLDNIKPPERSL